MKGFISGAVFALVLVVVVGLLAVEAGAFRLDADAGSNPFERWLAATALARTLAGTERLHNPLTIDAVNEIAGIRLYVKNCAVCHGTADGKPSATAQGLYQQPPQFATDGVEDDPSGTTYYKIEHGIRFTGMPAFGKVLSDTEAWQVAMFLHHMDKLAPPAEALWRTIPTSADLVASDWKVPLPARTPTAHATAAAKT